MQVTDALWGQSAENTNQVLLRMKIDLISSVWTWLRCWHLHGNTQNVRVNKFRDAQLSIHPCSLVRRLSHEAAASFTPNPASPHFQHKSIWPSARAPLLRGQELRIEWRSYLCALSHREMRYDSSMPYKCCLREENLRPHSFHCSILKAPS